ncbi:MAG: hypothetical protein JWP36_13 [Paucimonas sp.]|jgi:hypothetical protein|nr:hypothetical protein [Paucimonas sp.]
MAIVRIATTEVQVDDTVYLFNSAMDADRFEACAATVDVSHCERDYPPFAKRAKLASTAVHFTDEATPAEDGGVYFKAIVEGRPVRCQVSLEALERHFNEPGTRPVDAYLRGREKIHAVAERMLRKKPGEHVLIRSADIGG